MKRGTLAIRAAAAFAACAAFAAGAAPAGGAEPIRAGFSSRLSLGYDSFIDRFTILDDDTAEAVHDVYAGLGNVLSLSKGAARANLSNLLRYGNQTMDESLDLDTSFEPARAWRVDLRGGFRYKHFREGSDYAAANDYLQGNALVKVRTRLSGRFRAGARARFELVDFDERTLFDYDYTYRDAGIELEAGSDYARSLLVSASVGSRETPDTTALGFDRILAEFDAREAAGRLSLQFGVSGDRRDYRENIRSDSWLVNSRFEAALGLETGRSVSIRGEAEILAYDRPDAVYFDSQFVRGGVRTRIPAGTAATLFLEPRYAQMLCADFAEERYREGSLILGVEAFGGERYWVSASYEPGYRDYTAAENYLYSDFLVNRVSIMGSLTLPMDYSINLFLDHEPERHSRREDDFSITLVSLDITKRF